MLSSRRKSVSHRIHTVLSCPKAGGRLPGRHFRDTNRTMEDAAELLQRGHTELRYSSSPVKTEPL